MDSYQKFEALPEGWTREIFVEGRAVSNAPYRWSGEQAPPAIGEAVQVYMNGLGVGIVNGYFVEGGWLGVLVKLAAPPAWWMKQNAKDPDRLAHIFGLELEPRKVKESKDV